VSFLIFIYFSPSRSTDSFQYRHRSFALLPLDLPAGGQGLPASGLQFCYASF